MIITLCFPWDLKTFGNENVLVKVQVGLELIENFRENSSEKKSFQPQRSKLD